MGLTAFDPESSTNGRLETAWGLPKSQASHPGDKAQAVAELLQHKFLAHTFGPHGEWEVRTTLVANRQTWRYRSSVFLRGKEMRKGFSPIDVERTRQGQQTGAVTEEMFAVFVAEAVEVHLVRCASVGEYSRITSSFSQTPPRHHWMKKLAVVLFSVAALLTAYWLWRGSNSAGPEEPSQKPPPHSVRWQSPEVSYHSPAGEPFVFPLPALERTPEGIPISVTLEASGDELSWLEFDPERLHIRGIAPLATDDQIYRLIVRAQAEQGGDSRLLVWLTTTAPPNRIPSTPQLPGHWTW